MKTRIVYIISLLLLCVSCNVEQNPQLSYVEGNSGGNKYRIHKIRIPENWKIVDAQLDFKQMHLEFDRGRGIEKQTLKYPFRSADIIDDYYEHFKFRGANRFGGLTQLHFTSDEEPQKEFNPPIGTNKIMSGIKEREEFAIFRTSTWLTIQYSVKKTGLGNLTFHNLRKHYAENRNNGENLAYFESIDGKMHFNIVFNDKEKRSFSIDKYYEQHENYDSYSQGHSGTENELSWTWRYRIVSNPIIDR